MPTPAAMEEPSSFRDSTPVAVDLSRSVTMANTNPFRWVEIYVQNMERAKKFYESVLNFKFQRLESPEALALDTEGNMFGLHSMK
jgi:predicted enzyme related to lactoylglutathione lyase